MSQQSFSQQSISQQSIGYLIWDVSRLVRKGFHNDPRMECLTMAKARALSRISYNQGIKQVELAEQLEIKPMSLVRVIDSLVEEGLIERRPDPADRRAYQLFLLPEADKELVKLKQVSNDIWAGALEGISESDVEQMISTLQKIHKNLLDK